MGALGFRVCVQVEREMECVEAALKTSFRREMAARPFVSDEIVWPAANNSQNALSSDDFLVDDLLDFSNDEGLVQPQEQEGEERNPKEEGGGEGEAAKLVSSASYSAEERFSAKKDELGPLPASELSVPVTITILRRCPEMGFFIFAFFFCLGFSLKWSMLDERKP